MRHTTPTETASFVVYGTSVVFSSHDSSMMAAVARLMEPFGSFSHGKGPAISIQFESVQSSADIPRVASEAARPVFARRIEGDRDACVGWHYDMVVDEGKLIANFRDEGVLVIDPARRRADGYLFQSVTCFPDVVEWYFHTAFAELLKQVDLYTVHATALERDGRGVLIPGYSGRGKTTAFLSLLRSGYRYLSDDHPLLRDCGTHVHALAFPMKIDVTDHSLSFFPELREAPPGVLRQGLHKKYFFAEEVYPTAVGTSCLPVMILFPHVVDAPRSWLEPLPKRAALEAIMPQCLVVFDPKVAEAEFQLLARLVNQAECYRLHFGRDVLDVPSLIDPLLGAARTEELCAEGSPGTDEAVGR